MYTHGLDNYKMDYLKEESNKINKVMDGLMEQEALF
jgi:hypothetical protein